jgi:hypothetical protein
MSERESAQKAYQDLQKSKNPSAFDTMGAFNTYYAGWNVNSSMALPLDMGKSTPPKSRAEAVASYNTKTPNTPKEEPGFWGKVFIGLEKAYNFTTQTVSFGLTLPEKNNPIYKDDFSFNNIKEAWDKSRDISTGRSIQRTILGRPLDEIENVFSGIAKTVSFGKLSGADKFLQDHILFAANDFNIFDKQQAEKAFREQLVGRYTSFGTDVVSRFVLDPTIVGGKIVKGYKAINYSVKGLNELNAILTGEKTGFRANKVKATFNDFITKTDGMDATDLFRVKAIRESANPASFADILADANKIEDVALRHSTKADIVKMAMGDADAGTRLMASSRDIAVKIGNLQDEVTAAKFFGAGLDKATGQLTMDLVNKGPDLEKAVENAALYEDELRQLHMKLSAEAILDPTRIPQFNKMSAVRQALGGDKKTFGYGLGQKFIDLRAGAAGAPVRVLTGFFYKRPRGWIDFTDNQSVQTVDNMLSRVRGIAGRQEEAYATQINIAKNRLNTQTLAPDEVKLLKNEIKSLEDNLKKAQFTVQRKQELFNEYTAATNAAERANAFQKIEQELFNTVAKQFGFDESDVRAAWGLFAGGRSKAHNIIRERAYTGATKTLDDGRVVPVGAKTTPVLGSEDLKYIIPLPLNETQLVKQLPVLDIDTMYNALNRLSRARRSEKVGVYYKTRAGAVDLIDGLDSLIKFEVLARIGYPVRNVSEGFLRIITTTGPLALVAGLRESSRKMFNNRFKDASLEDMYQWSDDVKLQAHRDELDAMRDLADDPDLIDAQIVDIDNMLAGKTEVKDKFGLGLRTIDGITYQDALGAGPEQAEFIKKKFIAESARIVDDHLSNTRNKLNNVFETTGDFVVIRGDDPNWAQAYERVVNRQVRNSKITQILLQNKPREQVINEAEYFLLKTDEGRKIMRVLAMGRDARAIAEANMDNIDELFPSWASSLKEIAKTRKVTYDDIKKTFGTDTLNYPAVNAAQVGAANGTHQAIRYASGIRDKFYKYFGEIPETNLVRQPLFVDFYRKRMDALVRNAIDTYPGDTIPPEYIRKLENNARQWARAELRRTVYDTSERIDAAYTMRYAFPFFGAFGDVAEKWSRIVVNDPTVFRKMDIVYNSPERLGITEERDGKTYINIPGEWVKRMSFGKVERPMAIPKTSLDLLFQGNQWWNPGAGWFVQIGTSFFIKAVPDAERLALVKEILPYGPTGTTPGEFTKDLLVQNSGAKRIWSLFDNNDATRRNLTVLIAMEENHRYDNGLRETTPTAKEIDTKVKQILALEAAAKLTLPFATNTRSPYQFYIDEWHRLREEDPENASQKFYDTYGEEYFIFSTSLSKNNTGIAATIEAEKRSRELSDLIAKNPEYGWFIVGDANAGEFSPSVYQSQRGTPVAPGSTKKFRESQDPYDAIASTQAEKGWITYNKGMDILEAERIGRGLPSLNVKAAEDLADRKRQFIDELSQENPEWAEIRGKIDTQKVYNFLKFAKEIISDPRVSGRADLQGMSDYLEGRDYVRSILATRGSKSINAVENQDIKEMWDTFTGGLLDEYISFSRVYNRILENDDLTKGL